MVTMLTKTVFFFLLPVLLLFGCSQNPFGNAAENDSDNGSTTGPAGTASLLIQNQSAATVFNVVWNGHKFNDGQAIGTGSNSQIDAVQEGGSYIFFNIMGAGSGIALRTQEFVVCQRFPFRFLYNTPIVEVANPGIAYTIESFLNKVNNPEGLYLPSHDEIIANLNAISSGINNVRILSYQLMQNLLWTNVVSGKENDGIDLARDSRIIIEVGFTGPVPSADVSKVLDRLFINFTNVKKVVSGGMTFPLPTHFEIQQAVMALDGAGTTKDVVVTGYIVNGSSIFAGYEIARPYGAVIEITVRYATTILTQARVRTEVIRIFATAGFNNVTVDPALW